MCYLIETKRLYLKNYEDTQFYFDNLCSLLCDKETMLFWEKPLELPAVENWLFRAIDSYRAHGISRLAVFRKQDDFYIGDCGLMYTQVNGEFCWDIGYIIHAKFWGKGYAPEASQAVMDYGLKMLALPEIYANMPAYHLASKRVAEKIGMQYLTTFLNPKNRMLPTLIYVKVSTKTVLV